MRLGGLHDSSMGEVMVRGGDNENEEKDEVEDKYSISYKSIWSRTNITGYAPTS